MFTQSNKPNPESWDTDGGVIESCHVTDTGEAYFSVDGLYLVVRYYNGRAQSMRIVEQGEQLQ